MAGIDTPPLPKGFTVISDNDAPPLPKGFAAVSDHADIPTVQLSDNGQIKPEGTFAMDELSPKGMPEARQATPTDKKDYYAPLASEIGHTKYTPLQRSVILKAADTFEKNNIYKNTFEGDTNYRDMYFNGMEKSGTINPKDIESIKQGVYDELSHRNSSVNRIASAPIEAVKEGVKNLGEVVPNKQTIFEGAAKGEKPYEIAADIALKPIGKILSGAFGLAGATGAGAAFYTASKALEEKAPEIAGYATAEIMPAHSIMGVDNNSPQYKQAVATVLDAVWGAGIFGGLFHSEGKTGKEISQKAVDKVKQMTPEQQTELASALETPQVGKEVLNKIEIENDLKNIDPNSPTAEILTAKRDELNTAIASEKEAVAQDHAINDITASGKDFLEQTKERLVSESENASETSKGVINEQIAQIDEQLNGLNKEEAAKDNAELSSAHKLAVDGLKGQIAKVQAKVDASQGQASKNLFEEQKQKLQSQLDGLEKDNPDKQAEPEVKNSEPQTFTAYRFGEDTGKDGVTFSSKNKDYSEQYATLKNGKPEDVKEVSITAKNPLVVELSPNEFSSPEAESKYIKQAKENGNDVVVFRDKANGDEFYAEIKTEQPPSEIPTPETSEAGAQSDQTVKGISETIPATPEASKEGIAPLENGKEADQKGNEEGLLNPTSENQPQVAGESPAPVDEALRDFTDEEIVQAYADRDNELANQKGKGYVEQLLHDYLGTIKKSDFDHYGDPNLLKGDKKYSDRIRKRHFNKDSVPLDVQVMEISQRFGDIEITPQDAIDYILDREANPDKYKKSKVDKLTAAARIPESAADILDRYKGQIDLSTIEAVRNTWVLTDEQANTVIEYLKNKENGTAEQVQKTNRKAGKGVQQSNEVGSKSRGLEGKEKPTITEKVDKLNSLKGLDRAARGIDNIAEKIGGKRNLLPEDKTSLIADLTDVALGLAEYTGKKGAELLQEVIDYFKKAQAKFTDKDLLALTEADLRSISKDFMPKEFEKGITKEELKTEWDNIGVDSDFKDGLKQDFGNLAESAREKIESGRVNADEVAQEYADNPNKPVSDENVAILLTRKRQLQNAIEELYSASPTDPAEIVENRITAAALQDKYEVVLKGTNNATTTAGRALRSVQMALEKDYSIASMKAQIAAIKGEPLTAVETAHIEALQKEILEKTKIIEDYEKEKAEARKAELEKQEKAKIEKLKSEAEAEKRKAGRTLTKEGLKKERETLFNRLGKIARESRSTLSANPIPFKMIPVLSRLAKNYIKDGALTTEQWIDDIHAHLVGAMPGLTVDHLKESLFGKRQPQPVDRIEMAKRAAQKRAQEKFVNLKKKYQLKQRTKGEVVRDALLKWQRFAILSGVSTLGKLTAAASARQFLTSPVEEGIGWAIGKVLPKKLVEGAPREGGFNARAEAKNITEAFKKATFKDIYQTAKTGKGELDILYGKEQLPPEALDFFGHLHGALKTMPKRGEFFRSFEKRMQNAIENGADATDPLVQSEIAAKSYEDGMRTIFMNDNAIVSAYNAFLTVLEKKGKDIGIPSGVGVFRALLPIIKIPSNFVGETTSYLAGGLKAAAVLMKGIDNLTPDQKDYVMRNLKKQTLGATLLTIGYLNADNIGGYYQTQTKKEKAAGGVGFGNVKMLGIEIPHLFLHAPALEMLQFGATIKKLQDKYLGKGLSKMEATLKALGFSSWGIAQQQPFIGATRAIDTASRQGNVLGGKRLLESFLVPKLIQEMFHLAGKEVPFFEKKKEETKPTKVTYTTPPQ